jgi:hypothetical protein
MHRSRLVWGLFLFAQIVITSSGALASERIEVPIKRTVLSNGDTRYSIPLAIGGSPIEAMLDSGSTGLRVLRSAVLQTDYVITDKSTVYSYGSGVRYTGKIANAVVTIGGVSTNRPTPIEVVNSVDCVNDKPRCPASRVSAADYRIGGSGLPKQGFYAIIGVNMARGIDDAANPLPRLGAHDWIILLPKPGDPDPGKLILNPNAADRAGYTLFRTDETFRHSPGAFHDAIAGCLVSGQMGGGEQKKICGPTALDTGVPAVDISSGNSSDLLGWGERALTGAPMEFIFKNDQGSQLSAKFQANSKGPWAIFTALHPNQPRALISASAPYFEFSVLYDQEHGIIGLRQR